MRAAKFANYLSAARAARSAAVVRFEDLITNPTAFARALQTLLGVPSENIDSTLGALNSNWQAEFDCFTLRTKPKSALPTGCNGPAPAYWPKAIRPVVKALFAATKASDSPSKLLAPRLAAYSAPELSPFDANALSHVC